MGADKVRTAAFLIIGNEILSGRTADINLKLLAWRLGENGVSLREARIVRDETGPIVRALRELKAGHDFVFTSGGIGPTHDDITTAAVAEAFGVKTSVNPEARAVLESYYSAQGVEITPARLKMATVPDGADLIANKATGAPAYRLGNVHVLAGVPSIFAVMLEEALDMIGSAPGYRSRTVRAFAGESTIADLLEGVQNRNPGLDVGSYPKMSGKKFYCELVVTGRADAGVDEAFDDLLGSLRGQGVEHEEITGPEAAP